MINEFINNFCDEEIDFIQIKDSYYLLSYEIKQIYSFLNENSLSLDEPELIGNYLGKITKNKFIPSFYLLEWINNKTNQKIIINSRASWLFLCGRDVFNKSIISSNNKGKVIVLNENNEVLGYGIFNNDGVKNLFDRGDFLRREKSKIHNPF
jgi:ribosome biogenesis protein Nip4